MEFDHRTQPAQEERDNSIIWWAASVSLWLTFVGGLIICTDSDSSDSISPEQIPATPTSIPRTEIDLIGIEELLSPVS